MKAEPDPTGPFSQEHHYAFSCRPDNPIPVYERTFGYGLAADRWIEEDPANRFVMIGMVPFDSYY